MNDKAPIRSGMKNVSPPSSSGLSETLSGLSETAETAETAGSEPENPKPQLFEKFGQI